MITLGKYGALGNNFFRFIHACSYAKEYKVELYYSDRSNINKYFKVDDNFINHKTTPWILNNRFLRSFLRRIDKSPGMVKIVNTLNIYLHDHTNLVQKDEQLALSRRKKNAIVFVLRDFRAHASLTKCVEDMRKAFDIKPSLTEKINQEYLELRKKYKLLLGVHVRRGDYREWREGKYYFSDEVYAKKLKEFIAFKKINAAEVGVVICSNGAPLIENFSGLNVCYAPRPEEEDLFLMKRCDYIFGPPSTFCSMSSFMGSVPLYFIEPDEVSEFEERLHICSY
jgi:hypothetical protein